MPEYHVSFNVPDQNREYGLRGDYRCIKARNWRSALAAVSEAIPGAANIDVMLERHNTLPHETKRVA